MGNDNIFTIPDWNLRPDLVRQLEEYGLSITTHLPGLYQIGRLDSGEMGPEEMGYLAGKGIHPRKELRA